MARHPLACVMLLTLVPGLANAGNQLFERDASEDSSTHRIRTVTAAPGVELEVLDWGGRGPAIVLLPGFGNTAHVFDDFAPLFTRAYRVIAVPRRGSGYSSAPREGWGTSRLASDVLAVVDRLALGRPVVIGHGAAGAELSWLGTHHPERIRGLVYLDAASPRAEAGRRQLLELSAPPATNTKPETAANRRLWLISAMYGGAVPPNIEMQLCCASTSLPHAALGDDSRPSLPSAATHHGGYEGVKVEALALYGVLPADAREHAAYALLPPRSRTQFEQAYGSVVSAQAADIEEFQRTAPSGRIHRILGAGHYLFLSHAQTVFHYTMLFLQRLSPPIE